MTVTEQPHVLIVEARFYEDIADELVKGATAELEKAGVTYDRIAVPGVFEIPATVRFAIRSMELGAASQHYAGYITLGCVIRGETDHYDHICREASHAMMQMALDHSIAHGFGVLTCENYEQAQVRAAVDKKNKGSDAAIACLRMMEIKKDLRLTTR
ncbi:MAG: 6,7-dimethyl-8-ribityllumazine synthase [Rhodospirillales bacterium]|nr:6,7-dimethyl-8-ribityllumazine synthase [Rhodospirillales bacterium]